MELSQALRLTALPRVAFVGAGGKTSAMFQVARELSSPVMVCATTHLALHQTRFADQHIILHSLEDTHQFEKMTLRGVILLTGPVSGDRTTGLPPELMGWLRQFCDAHLLPLLIEADGARQLPLKAPGDGEPALPPETETVVVVAGLSGVGLPLTAQTVFRPELFAAISGLSLGDEITPEALTRVLLHPNGGLKHIPSTARQVVLLNQADTSDRQAVARSMSDALLRAYDAVLISSLHAQPARVWAVHERVAGVVLAAGAAERFGQPKQLLSWRGKPLVWHCVQTALESGLSPVIVVGGAYTAELRRALAGVPVELVHNPRWREGQGTSVRCGLDAVSTRGAATIFFLADQPQVCVPLILSLREIHAQRRPSILGPIIDDRRSNPVLFDRCTYQAFESLEGDMGARQIFAQFPVEWLPWNDESLAQDIDTPDDFHQFLRRFGR